MCEEYFRFRLNLFLIESVNDDDDMVTFFLSRLIPSCFLINLWSTYPKSFLVVYMEVVTFVTTDFFMVLQGFVTEL